MLWGEDMKAKEGADTPTDTMSYHVYLRRPPQVMVGSGSLGLTYRMTLNRLLVQEVAPAGLVAEYNSEVAALRALCHRQVSEGDSIVCVNGSTDLDEMRAALKNASDLHICMHRDVPTQS
uniref:PDZ domain-containing protein n=1 Tax=Noctiluca scintillans TaxID=2966 RepID=A0A7S1AQW3_NOCSC|mmetsp:Transcript_56323/g.150590  ORF Transcript_56323/g.150590 Transcript_56323/m.150590 type:complete len:120 (+) Transcript_56323:58-417(+)|eukprot:CAMPEP_0194526718 /NCGR_PEP_ID=MMETSP0253-20130528/62599_1 /TAXON_ID=2966 /ORGANISM="Noctiluca scintillans" /LENGTH=119 /DNA_ID=CAMNT_0039371575 /DNA_START=14 /DNA_END=373 /DNA_ORIENTATION=+